MSNLVLYRKYRPKKFSEVVGQEPVVTTLLNAVAAKKTAHAYLFTGPRGSGKTTVARILAKAVNCENEKEGEPCNKCNSCKEINEERAMDIVEIDAASHRGIEEIRELREGIRFSPTSLSYKVFILDEAHQLTSGAANALLKMLEESPEHVVFILATTEPQKMIPTIISRCQRFDFRKITAEDIIKRLEKIAKKEGFEVEKEALLMIASYAGGSLRDAEGFLSQMTSFLKEGSKIRKEDIKELLGVVEREVVADFVDFLKEGSAIGAIELMEGLFEKGVDAESFFSSITYYLREMMILKIVSGEEDKEKQRSLVGSLLSVLTKEEVERMKKQTEEFEIGEIKKIIDIFLEMGEKIKYSPIPHLPLEMAVAEVTETLKKTEK